MSDDGTTARPGDWLEERGIHGDRGRTGEILEVLGRPGHLHYRVRWDEKHESLAYPADGVRVIPRRRGRSKQASSRSED